MEVEHDEYDVVDDVHEVVDDDEVENQVYLRHEGNDLHDMLVDMVVDVDDEEDDEHLLREITIALVRYDENDEIELMLDLPIIVVYDISLMVEVEVDVQEVVLRGDDELDEGLVVIDATLLTVVVDDDELEGLDVGVDEMVHDEYSSSHIVVLVVII